MEREGKTSKKMKKRSTTTSLGQSVKAQAFVVRALNITLLSYHFAILDNKAGLHLRSGKHSNILVQDALDLSDGGCIEQLLSTPI